MKTYLLFLLFGRHILGAALLLISSLALAVVHIEIPVTSGDVDAGVTDVRVDAWGVYGSAGQQPTCTLDVVEEGTIWCQNGIIRVRTTLVGITWFDVFHPGEGRWYVGKNNLNVNTRVEGIGWESSEIHDVVQSAEVISSTATRIVARLRFAFPNGAKIYTDLTLEADSPFARFELHEDAGSAAVSGFQWHITFGQAEAVAELHFGDHHIIAADLPTPFAGGPLEVQHVEWYSPWWISTSTSMASRPAPPTRPTPSG